MWSTQSCFHCVLVISSRSSSGQHTAWCDHLCAAMRSEGKKFSLRIISSENRWLSTLKENDSGPFSFCASLSGFVPFRFALRFCYHEPNSYTCGFIYPPDWCSTVSLPCNLLGPDHSHTSRSVPLRGTRARSYKLSAFTVEKIQLIRKDDRSLHRHT